MQRQYIRANNTSTPDLRNPFDTLGQRRMLGLADHQASRNVVLDSRATCVPQPTGTHGPERTTPVNASRPLSWLQCVDAA
jgi:hypothetical protein